MEILTGKVIAKFKSLISDSEECIEWPGYRNLSGYGVQGTTIGGVKKNFLAHRVSYTIFNGVIPSNLGVLHSCDNPSCINPKHLFVGTQEENNLDCKNKNRLNHNKVVSSKILNSKLSYKDVLEIRRFYSEEGSSLGFIVLAKQFGVSQTAIKKIVDKKIRLSK